IQHLLFECSTSRALWTHLGVLQLIDTLQHLSIPLIERIHLLIKQYQHLTPHHIPPATLIPFCLWGICLHRNQNLFNNRNAPLHYLQILNRAAEFHFLVSPPRKNTHPTPLYIKWNPPPQNHYKLNTNGTASRNPGLNGKRGVIRSSDGNWIIGFSRNIAFCTSIQMELTTLLYGLRLSLQYGYYPLEINLDAKEVITLLHTNNPHYTNLVNDCRLLLRQLGDPIIQHIYREANMVADGLAKYGTQLPCNSRLQLFDTTLPFVYNDFQSDKA
ncbi:putative ribonuclease h protein, partial [Nicotiana attenuata]